ncbi:sugar-binding transcriptional regulator, partial [Candidatus Nomurabacteria bacterium]|nr:sugar-binding transcriptional regulator [Candidatus Nomurabacteria bacterium]
HYIQAPLIVRSKEVKEILIKETNISKAIELCRNVDIAFLGIGTTDPDLNALLRAGFIDEKEAKKLRSQGAVGMICGQFYTIDGDLLDTDINERVIGLKATELQYIDTVIGLACGEKKTEAIFGALKGKYLNAIITDEIVAKKLLGM